MIIELTPNAKAIIRRLHNTGLYGETESDVVERLFYEKLRDIESQEREPPTQWGGEPQIK